MKRICLSAAFILAFLSPLSATTVQRLSFDDLVAKAQSIVVGQVIDSRTAWDDRLSTELICQEKAQDRKPCG
jgi:hypothetical protein